VWRVAESASHCRPASSVAPPWAKHRDWTGLAAPKVGANNRQDRNLARCFSPNTRAVEDALTVEQPTKAHPVVAGKILYWPDALLLRSSFVTAIRSQRHPADIRRLLLRYVENDAHYTQSMSPVAPLSTRCHDATPGLSTHSHTASLCDVNEYSIHCYRQQCKDFLKTFGRSLPHMQKEMKTAQVNLRIHPSLKAAAEKAAEGGHRSLTSLIEKLLADYCKRKGFLK
jgi:hypothetical protein